MRNWTIINGNRHEKYYSDVFMDKINNAYSFMMSILGRSYGIYLEDADIDLYLIEDEEEKNGITGYCLRLSDSYYKIALSKKCIDENDVMMTLIHELCHLFLFEYYKKDLLNYESDGSTIFILFNLYCQLKYDRNFRYTTGTYKQHNKVYSTPLYWECKDKDLFNMDIYYMMKFLDSVVRIYEDITRKLFKYVGIHLLFTSDENLLASNQRASFLSVKTFKPDSVIKINNLLDVDELDSIAAKLIKTHTTKVSRGASKSYMN